MPGHHSGRRFLEQELSETPTFASFVWIHMFLSAGQGLLSAVSWCSVRSSISEDVSLMNQWREKYPTSTDSSVSCHLPNSLVISVQVNDFFFLVYTVVQTSPRSNFRTFPASPSKPF